MTYFRRSGGQIVLLVLALASLGVSIYLTLLHYDKNVPLVCSTGGFVNCEHVLTSRFSVIPGTSIPVSIPGILWSIIAAALAFTAWRIRPEDRRLRVAEVVWGALGLLPIFYLIYAELVLINNLCFWCTVVHIIVFLFLLTSLFLAMNTDDVEEIELDEDEEVADVPVARR